MKITLREVSNNHCLLSIIYVSYYHIDIIRLNILQFGSVGYSGMWVVASYPLRYKGTDYTQRALSTKHGVCRGVCTALTAVLISKYNCEVYFFWRIQRPDEFDINGMQFPRSWSPVK